MGEVPEPQSRPAQVLQPAVDRLGRPVRGPAFGTMRRTGDRSQVTQQRHGRWLGFVSPDLLRSPSVLRDLRSRCDRRVARHHPIRFVIGQLVAVVNDLTTVFGVSIPDQRSTERCAINGVRRDVSLCFHVVGMPPI